MFSGRFKGFERRAGVVEGEDWEWEAAGGGGIASVGARGKEPGDTASGQVRSKGLENG